MPQSKTFLDPSISRQAIPAGAEDFSNRIHGLLDGLPKSEAAVASALEGQDQMVDRMAAALYSLASMLVGEGEDAVRLVETAIANSEVSPCCDPVEARMNSRRALGEAAIQLLRGRDPGALAVPAGLKPVGNCIDDDAEDVSGDELERLIAGPERDRVREWLAGLSAAVRTVFVLRAVAGLSTAATAALLASDAGPAAAGWTADAVRECFRQGLCSLASQLLQATAAR
jgi:hypothetical protein